MPFANTVFATTRPQLVEAAHQLLWDGLAVNTRAAYSTGTNSFLELMRSANITDPLPASPSHVAIWMAALHSRGIKYNTIRVYLFGLRSTHKDLALDSSIDKSALVERTYRGIKRTQGIANTTKKRFAVTFAVLRKLDAHLNASNPYHRLIRAAAWIATAGLFRIGELTVDRSKSPNSIRTLTMASLRSLQSDPPVLAIHLKASKTDVFRKEVDVKIANKAAIAHLQTYLNRRSTARTASDPLFAKEDGKPLERAELLTAIRTLISAANVDTADTEGFSFRRGGATSLEAAHVSDRMIKTVGRWESAAYIRYIDTPIQHFIDASADL